MTATANTLRDECEYLAIRDRHVELISLLDHAPADEVRNDGTLLFWKALALLSAARFAEGEAAAKEFRSANNATNDKLACGRSHLLRAVASVFEGDSESALHHAEEAAATLPEFATHERFRAWATVDVLSGHFGDTEKTKYARRQLVDLRDALPLDQHWWHHFVIPNRADLLLKQGYLQEAETLLNMHLRDAPPAMSEVLRMRLAIIALERGDPGKASELLGDITQDTPIMYWSLEWTIILAQIRAMFGDTRNALDSLQEAIAVRTQLQSRVELLRAQIQMCEIWIERGEITLAEAWIGLISRSLDPWPRTFGHPLPRLIQATLELEREQWSEAIRILEPLRVEGLRRKHNGILVSIYSHLAYAYAGLDDDDSAIEMSKLAMQAGADGTFFRSYTVLGTDIRNFLARTPSVAVADRSLALSRQVILSPREIQVLTLVEEGHRNTEIADQLFISPSTVKNHLARISRRLGVTNRRDAVLAARQLGILPGPGSDL